jgi:two-component system, chemotaxis family, protein-glutamate methylesterase/glutaminase
LQMVLGALPADFAVPVLVVLHLEPRYDSQLASILRPSTPLRMKPARVEEPLEPGTVYLGVPDMHLEVAAGHVHLSDTARVHFCRPSVDVLFHSMAVHYGNAACGVVLSGAGYDGARGLAAIKAAGGTAIVQNPATALHGSMPRAALAVVRADMMLEVEEIGPALVRLAMRAGQGRAAT